MGDPKIETSFVRLSDFSKIFGSPQHNVKDHNVLEYLINVKPNIVKSDFDFYFNTIIDKLKTYYV